MVLMTLIVSLFCVTGVLTKSLFNFREHCHIKHMSSSYSATCNGNSHEGSPKDLFIDSRSTLGMSEMDLISFRNVSLDRTLQVENITIRNTDDVSLYITNVKLKHLTLESIDSLTLRSYHLPIERLRELETVILRDVNQIKIISDRDIKWLIKSAQISNIKNIELESNLQLQGQNISIVKSHVLLKAKSSVNIYAASATIDSNVLYFQDNGSLRLTVDQLLLKDNVIDFESGTIVLKNSQNNILSNNSLYKFDRKSLLLLGSTNVQLSDNYVLTSDLVDVINFYRDKDVIFKNNAFNCTNCVILKELVSDLKDVGDVNFCYTECKMSLNQYKKLLQNHFVCKTADSEVTFENMCSAYSEAMNREASESASIFPWLLCTALFITVIVIVLLVLSKKSRSFKLFGLSNNFPTRLSSENSIQVMETRNPSHELDDEDDSLYEPIGLPMISVRNQQTSIARHQP